MMLHSVALISVITLTSRCSRRVASALRTPAAGRSCVIGGIALGTPSRHHICAWHHSVMFNHLSLLTVRDVKLLALQALHVNRDQRYRLSRRMGVLMLKALRVLGANAARREYVEAAMRTCCCPCPWR